MSVTAKLTLGYSKLAAAASGKVAANTNGRDILVIDSTTTSVGIIL